MALTCMIIINVLTLVAAIAAAFYAHSAREHSSEQNNVTVASVAATHHRNAMEIARAVLAPEKQ